MKKLVLTTLGFLTLIGCGDIVGTAHVTQSFAVKNSKGQMQEVSPGDYDASFAYDGRNKVKFVFKKASAGADVTASAKVGRVNIPENGPFNFSAESLGQSWSAAGQIVTTTSQSQPVNAYETCTYQAYLTVCHEDGRGHVYCGEEEVTVEGVHPVTFTNITKIQAISLSIIDSQNPGPSANFAATTQDVSRNYLYEGECLSR